MLLVNVGRGRRFHADWVNLDAAVTDPAVQKFDCPNPLPFHANVVDVIYASHLVEHLYIEEAEKFVRDCHKVLRPGGVIRLATPDFERLATT